MAEALLGLGSSGASGLNQELIDKLKSAERTATVEPIEKNIENIEADIEKFSEIDQAVLDLLEVVKPFDFFVTEGVNAFEEKSASTSGDSVTFDAADVTALNNGFTTVNVTQIGQKDVYQSNSILEENSFDDEGNPIAFSSSIGSLTLQVGSGEVFEFQTGTATDTSTTPPTYGNYSELASAIDAKVGIAASFEEVLPGQFRMIVKSEEVGSENSITISGTASASLGFDLVENHKLTAQDMNITVDGVDYEASSNEITIDGLNITANALGTSTINIKNDTSLLATQMTDFVDKYNSLVDLVNTASAADSTLYNKTGLRDILDQVKQKVFGTYGENSDKSLFSVGFNFNQDLSGKLIFDATKFNEAVVDDIDGLKELFIGDAANEGFGTQLKSLIDEMNFSNGSVSLFESSLTNREEILQEDLEKAQKDLDTKYQILTDQFAMYASVITQFETAFGGLKMMIDQSVASN